MPAKVLIPIDGRQTSTAAEDYAIKLNEMTPLSAIVLNVVDTRDLDGHGIDAGLRETVLETKRRFAEQAVQNAVEHLRHAGIECQRMIKKGDPADEICLTALNEAVDMIIIADSSSTPSREQFIGNVSRNVLYRAAVPVVLVKTP